MLVAATAGNKGTSENRGTVKGRLAWRDTARSIGHSDFRSLEGISVSIRCIGI